jgi:chemotaxis protein CheC
LIGDPEMEIAGVYLEAAGEIPGQMLLLMHLPTAFQFCDILLELPPGATQELGELEISALGEVGNIVGSFFLNSLADNVGLTLHITPPGIVCDMAGAAIDLALVGVAMYADEAIVIDANFEAQGRRLPAWFLVFPEPEHLQHILGLEAA